MTEPLVLLPGMMCDDRIFAPQIRALGKARAITLAPVGGGDRIEQIAAGLSDQLPQRFALAGQGMGAHVAMELFKRMPKRISRLCLMGAGPLSETPREAAAREPLIIGAQSGRLSDVMRQAMRPEYLAPGPGRMALLNQMYQMAGELGAEVFVRQSRALQRRPDQQGTVRKIRVPTLILGGAHDGLTPARRLEFLAGLIAGARLHIIEDAGHMPTLETPEATTAALRDWLEMPLVLR